MDSNGVSNYISASRVQFPVTMCPVHASVCTHISKLLRSCVVKQLQVSKLRSEFCLLGNPERCLSGQGAGASRYGTKDHLWGAESREEREQTERITNNNCGAMCFRFIPSNFAVTEPLSSCRHSGSIISVPEGRWAHLPPPYPILTHQLCWWDKHLSLQLIQRETQLSVSYRLSYPKTPP